MMNMDIERIVREKCAELGIEYDDSITKALENGEALSEDTHYSLMSQKKQ